MNKIKGTLYVIFAAIIYGFIPFFATTAFENGFNEYTFILGRSAFASLILFVYMKNKGISFSLEKKEIKDLIIVSIIGHGFMILTLISSYKYMPTSIATAIHFVYPIIIMIGGVKYYGEKINIDKIILITTAVTGIFFIIGFNENQSISFIGFILSFISGVFYAYYVLKLGNGSLKKFEPIKLIFYVLLINTIFFILACIFVNRMNISINSRGLSYIIIISLILCLAMILFKKGLELINTVTAGILSTFEPVTSLLVGILILDEKLRFHHIVGSILIITSAVLATIIENKSNKKIKFGLHKEIK